MKQLLIIHFPDLGEEPKWGVIYVSYYMSVYVKLSVFLFWHKD